MTNGFHVRGKRGPQVKGKLLEEEDAVLAKEEEEEEKEEEENKQLRTCVKDVC